jgi:hypothetical protein
MEAMKEREEGNEKRKEGRNEKAYKKAEEFRRYLDGERSARDPRFDLKVFQYVLSFFLVHIFTPLHPFPPALL